MYSGCDVSFETKAARAEMFKMHIICLEAAWNICIICNNVLDCTFDEKDMSGRCTLTYYSINEDCLAIVSFMLKIGLVLSNLRACVLHCVHSIYLLTT